MNTIFKKIMLLVAFTATLTLIHSCQKDSESFNNDNTLDKGINVLSYSNPNSRNGEIEILEFQDMETFRMKVRELEQLQEQNDLNFIAKHKNLTEEQINEMDSIEGFNYYEPLLEFNRKLGFKSLIDDYIVAENFWLNQSELQTNLDPDIKFGFLNDGELALLNSDRSVKIAGKIMVYKVDGKIEINDASFETLIALTPYNMVADIDLSQYDNLTVRMIAGNEAVASSSCISQKTHVEYHRLNGDNSKQMKCKIRLSSGDYWHGTEIFVKTKSFRKNRHGVWVNNRTDVKAGLVGSWYTVWSMFDYYGCGTDNNNANGINSKSNSYVATFFLRYNPNQTLKVSHNKLNGIHQVKTTLKYHLFY